MPIRFTPTGNLDLQTDPKNLSESSEDKTVSSGDMQRCTNMDLSHPGKASTRAGSSVLATLAAAVNHLQWMNGYRYEFCPSAIYRNGTLVEGSYSAGDDWTSVVYNPYNVTTLNIYATNGTLLKRIEGASAYTWGIAAPIYQPGVSSGPNGGTYSVCYTYCRKDGVVLEAESNPSPVTDVTGSSIPLSVTWTASGDSQVTHVRFYRTMDAGGTYYYADEFAVGLGSGSLDALDEDLGAEVEYDHDPPPSGISILFGPNYEGVLFALVDNKVYWSKAKQPEYWPTSYWIEVSGPDYPLVSATVSGTQFYVASEQDLYQIQGSSSSTFISYMIGLGSGTRSKRVFLGNTSLGLLRMASDGLHQYSGGEDVESLPRLRPVFEGVTVGSVPGITPANRGYCWAVYYRGKIYLGYPSSGETYPQNVLVTDLQSGATTHYSYPYGLILAIVDPTSDNLVACDDAGQIITLEDSASTDDNGTAISWDIQSKDFGTLRKYFPRWSKYDVGISSGSTATVYVMLDGVSIQSHSLSVSRDTKKRLITTAAGDRLSLRVAGTGPVDIYSLEAE